MPSGYLIGCHWFRLQACQCFF